MRLFQQSVLRNYLANWNKKGVKEAFEVYKRDFLSKIDNIKKSKEEQYQYGFLDDLFVKVLGYTLNPTSNYNLTTEFKNLTNNKKADGAILKDGRVIGVIELKSIKTKSIDSIVNQAFNYKNNHPSCRYIIISNFEKLRFYIDYSDRFIEFNLFDMTKEEFEKFYYILNKESVFADIPLKLKEASKLQEESISNELYKKYANFREILFENIVKNNPDIDRLILLNKTQTILDRMIFIFFAEDRGILPPNTIKSIIERYQDDIEDRSLYHFYKIYFKAIDKGNTKLQIASYNGGLFESDEILDNLKIDDNILEIFPQELSRYDFNSDIDVNILGHIFENSLTDIEELRANIQAENFDFKKSKRKRDGVFYTPEYITKYIVNNTLGKLCNDKKIELGIDNIDIQIPKNPKKLNKTEQGIKEKLQEYREFLLSLKILDPACGSGAFLNQALDFLLNEHKFIDEGIKILMGGNVLGLYDIKKDVLENNLYGVDINAEAVEIAKLSLWLRTVESGRKLNRLANKIKVGNSLIKDKNISKDAFNWREEFPEVFEASISSTKSVGFDVVIGNPPYVQLQSIKDISKKLESSNYETFEKTGDLYVLFFELGVKLLKENGLLGYITSNKWLRAKYGKSLRKFLSTKTSPKILIDLGGDIFESATVDSSILIVKKSEKEPCRMLGIDLSKEKNFKEFESYYSEAEEINECSEDTWVISNKIEKSIKNKIEKIGTPLKEWDIEIYRGITTGLNDAFIIDGAKRDELIAKDAKSAEIIKPILRGKDIKRYSFDFQDKWLINSHNNPPVDINEYPAIKEHLNSFEPKLSKRYDKGDTPYNLRNCAYLDEFEKEKIAWQRVTREPSFCIVEKDIFILDSMAFLISENNLFLMTILNSKLIKFYLDIFIHKYGEKGYLLSNQFVEQIPIPKISEDEQKPFIKKAEIMLKLHKDFHSKKQKFLKRLKSNFELDKLSKKLENFYDYDFATLLKELKKKKITLKLTEQDEWEEYFESYKKELQSIQNQINQTDREIDKMVYNLYKLTPQEIEMIEGK